MESFENNQEGLLSEAEVNALINNAILEVVETFKDEMTERDREMLISVTKENINPGGRIINLQQIPTMAVGVSENLRSYVNQALQTIREGLTEKEKERFQGWGKSQLDEVN